MHDIGFSRWLPLAALGTSVLFACGGTTDSTPEDATDSGPQVSACEDLGGTCLNHQGDGCPAGTQEQTSPRAGCAATTPSCCLPLCPPSRPDINSACTTKGKRCLYIEPQCISSTCIGGSWDTEVYDTAQCPWDAGAGGN